MRLQDPAAGVAERLKHLQDSIREICRRSNRVFDDIRLILVSKGFSAEAVREGAKSGFIEFGENRVQELIEKKKELPAEIKWHMIGHLQTNKVRQVIRETVLIQSLDRVELVGEIEKQALRFDLPEVNCLVQVNCSGEASKSGLPPEKVADFVSALPVSSRIRIRGLMTIGPLTDEESITRSAFQSLKRLQINLQKKFPERDWNILSMGMSGDYRIALEEGSNMLRIGSAVFGARTQNED